MAMMPLTEISRLKQTVTDSWDSPVADQVAALWGHPAGTARWWRSSASHVFVVDVAGRRSFLRFVPGAYRDGEDVAVVAGLMAQLSRGGSAVVRPVASESGALADRRGANAHRMDGPSAPGSEPLGRDLADPTGHPADEHRARFDAFIAGYRSLRPLDEQDIGHLPLFAGLHAAASMVRIRRALGRPGQGEPGWMTELRGKLTEKARAHRQLVINTAAQAS